MIYLNNVTEEDDKVTQEVSSDDSSTKEDTTSTDKDSDKKQEQEKDIKPIDISLNGVFPLVNKNGSTIFEKKKVLLFIMDHLTKKMINVSILVLEHIL